jgi:hypothetical protein
VFDTEIRPALTGESRYQAAMVASALAIVARMIADGTHAETRQHAALAELYGSPQGLSLAALEQRLARELRAGASNPGRERQVRAALLSRALVRLELSNPSYASTFPIKLST